MNDTNSLAHTKWNCKYHIVFAPKYRRKVFFGEKRREIGKILRQLCAWKKVTIVEAEVCSDHIHMLLEIPPKIAVSSFVGYLKGKSSLMIYEQFPNLKYKYRNREFKENRRVYPKPIRGRQDGRTTDNGKLLSPFTGCW